jgi:hypothetical protein
VKTPLEIVWCQDGTAFLNFWDSANGFDVCCQIDTGGRLINHNGAGQEVSFGDFIAMVENVVQPFSDVVYRDVFEDGSI